MASEKREEGASGDEEIILREEAFDYFTWLEDLHILTAEQGPETLARAPSPIINQDGQAEESDDEDEVWRELYSQYAPNEMRCNCCGYMKHTDRIIGEEATRKLLTDLANACEDCRINYKKMVRYGHFTLRLLKLVDSKACYRHWILQAQRRREIQEGKKPRYRMMAEYNICEPCSRVIENKITEYYTHYYSDPKEPDEED